jgi:Ca2+-dependent lipid-binding protein
MQAAEESGSFDVIKVLLKPLGVLQVHVESAHGFTSSYTRIAISGIEMARTKTAQNSPDFWSPIWEEVLYVPLRHATKAVWIEVVGQGNRGKYYCQLSTLTLVSDLMVETGGILMMREPSRRTYYGDNADRQLCCAISFYPCLAHPGVPKQPNNNEPLQSNFDFQSPWDLTRLNSQVDPGIFSDGLIKCETGFIMLKFLDWKALQGPSSVQFQVLLDDLPFPSYSHIIAQIGNSKLKRIAHCFIRDLSLSKITFRMKEGGGQFDEAGRVFASRTQNTLNLLEQCLVCVHTPL